MKHRNERVNTWLVFSAFSVIFLDACGGGGKVDPPVFHAVTLNWNASHESGVNQAGGGYQVAISGKPTINVPYTSGATTPTTATTSLLRGKYTVTVSAYAALDATGGNAGSLSPGQSITVTVP